jgi:hypothetical protein
MKLSGAVLTHMEQRMLQRVVTSTWSLVGKDGSWPDGAGMEIC